MLIFGALFGLLSGRVQAVGDYTTIASMDPHIILHVFLPVLIFESAFSIEVHSFLRASLQIILLAIPGFSEYLWWRYEYMGMLFASWAPIQYKDVILPV